MKKLGDLALAYAEAKKLSDAAWEVPDAEFDEDKSVEASRKESEARDALLEHVVRMKEEGLL